MPAEAILRKSRLDSVVNLALRCKQRFGISEVSSTGATERGLRRLVRLGAVALDPQRMPDSAALALLMADYRPPSCVGQIALFEPLDA